MTATAAEALELALWLHRAPARRAALAGRPLPEGIGQLLRVAGGAPDHVAAAARITGEDEATTLEAVRFYLQQMLFQDDADAYRVLGLRPDATQDQAREHHRLLQHWLHPDRQGEDKWESAYAVRVNRAWGQLRTAQSRVAYDTMLAAVSSSGRRPGSDPNPPPVPELMMRPLSPPANRSRNLTLLVLLACAGLLLVATLRNEVPPRWQEFRTTAPDASKEEASGFPDGSSLAETVDTLAAATAAHIEDVASVIATPISRGVVPNPVDQTAPAPARAPAESVVAPVPDAVTSSPVRVIEQRSEPPPVAADGEVRPAMPLAASTLAAANEPDPSPLLSGRTITTAVPDQASGPSVALRGFSAQPIPDALARMHQARARAEQVLQYLGDPAAVQPPVWNDLATAEAAMEMRNALQTRLPAGANLALRDSQWRLSSDGARLESTYRAEAVGSYQETGLFALDFVWREDRLLVRELTMEPR